MARTAITPRPLGVVLLVLLFSGSLTNSALAQWEPSSDRPGNNYRKFSIAKEVEAFVAVKQCEDACKKEAQCKAFTYVKPGVQGGDAVCYLKNTVPARVSDTCCTSGVVRPQTKADYCNNYSLAAQLAAKNNVNYGCAYTGAMWTDNYATHYDWCMRVSEADSKNGADTRKSLLDQCQKPSTSGDLAAYDVCYEIQKSGDTVVGGDVSFYAIAKNVGSTPWRSKKKGEYVVHTRVGSISKEGKRELPAYPYWELGAGKTAKLSARSEPYDPDSHYSFAWLLRHSEDINPANNEDVEKPFDTFTGGLTGSRLAYHPWLLANKACTRVPIKHQPLNLYWNDTDLNGIPLNSSWGWQLEHSYDEPSYYPDLEWLAPLLQIRDFNFFGIPVKKLGEERDFSKTTDQPTFKEYGGNYIPGPVEIPVPGVCGPHLNWKTPVTYEGRVKWAGYDSNDGDLNFYLFTDNGNGAVKKDADHGGIKVEFDSDETVDHFHTPWWSQRLRLKQNPSGPPMFVYDFEEINNKAAIVTGLWGFDCAHECASELHPAWAMAIRVKDDDPNDDVWAMFVRNWGNEGFCSDHTFPVTYPSHGEEYVYKFLLPWRPGAVSVAIEQKTQFLQREGVGSWGVDPMPNKGVVVAFSLPAPEKRQRINGELHLKWTYPQGVSAKPYPVSRTAADNAKAATGVPALEDTAMNERIMQALPPKERKLYGDIVQNATLKDSVVTLDLEQSPRLVPGASHVAPSAIPQVEVRPDIEKMKRKRVAVERLQISPDLYLQMQPIMEDVHGDASRLAPVTGGIGGAGTPTLGGGSQGTEKETCQVYAESAVAQQRENLERGCGYQGPEWNLDLRAHLNWCLHGENVKFAAQGTRGREDALARCRVSKPAATQPADDRCSVYAQTAIDQQKKNLDLSCGFVGPVWSNDYRAHYLWCQGVDPALTEAGTLFREGELRKCDTSRGSQ